jgi:hypothetical protein
MDLYACTYANLFTYLDKPVSLANLHTNGWICDVSALFKGERSKLARKQVDLSRIGTNIPVAWSDAIHHFRHGEIWQNSDASSQREDRRNTGRKQPETRKYQSTIVRDGWEERSRHSVMIDVFFSLHFKMEGVVELFEKIL